MRSCRIRVTADTYVCGQTGEVTAPVIPCTWSKALALMNSDRSTTTDKASTLLAYKRKCQTVCLLDSSVLILVPLQLCIQAGVSHPKSKALEERSRSHWNTKEADERASNAQTTGTVNSNTCSCYQSLHDKPDNKKKSQSFMHLHHHTSNLKFNMLLHGRHDMFSADYL